MILSLVCLGIHMADSLNITILEQSSHDFSQMDKNFANDVIINSLRQSIYVSATISLVTRYHKISGKAFILYRTLQEICL